MAVKKTLAKKAETTKVVNKPAAKKKPLVVDTKVLPKLVKLVEPAAKLKPFKAVAKKGSLAQRHTCTCHLNKKNKMTHVHDLKRIMPKNKRCYNCCSTSHLVFACKENHFYKAMTRRSLVPKRKSCYIYGSLNHLSFNCKKNPFLKPMIKKPKVPKMCYHCGSISHLIATC